MQRSLDKEMMDLPANPQDLLEDDLRNLRAINRYLGGYRGVLRGLARLIGEQKLDAFSLLDVGTGSGDIPVAIARWGKKRDIGIKIVAIEPEPTTARVAAKLTQQKSRAISVVRADGMAPPFPCASFDFVLASQLLHHFSENEIIAALRRWSQIARKGVIVSDLIRHPIAYHGIRIITRAFTRNMMTLTDAPLSVHRAFTLAEWRELLSRAAIGPFEIISIFPFRMVAICSVAGSISLPSSPSLEGEDKGEGGVLGRSASG